MTKLIFRFSILLFGIFFMVSCDNDGTLQDFDADTRLIQEIQNSTDRIAIDVNELPSLTIQTTNEDYFETFIETATKVPNKGYELEMENGTTTYFRTSGEEILARKGGQGYGKRGIIKPEDLPVDVLEYIATNYPDVRIKGGKEYEGDLYVGLGDKRILVFDTNGNFVEETTIEDLSCGGRGKGRSIAIEDLPQNIMDYISTNYPSAEIKKAKYRGGDKYVVGLLEGETKILTIFDTDGNFLYERRKE